jgi:glutaconate CoA-transferase subunit B
MDYSKDEMMTVAAARLLWDGATCFVGIGLPSAAANLARLTHAPKTVLIYESGTIGTRPDVLPLSIGDGELADTADCIVPLPEIFSYWLQGGRIDVGFLGAAQIDRYGNLNSTVIGDYAKPKTRLPGAGGAPEIAANAKQTFVADMSFRSSGGFLEGGDSRARSGAPGAGPQVVITDYGLLKPHPETRELQLASVYEGVDPEAARAACGWPLGFADRIETVEPPSAVHLEALRALHARSDKAHATHHPLPI